MDNLQWYFFDFAVSDDMVYQFITTPPVSKYFSDLVNSLKEQCVHLDGLVHPTEYVSFNFLEKLIFICYMYFTSCNQTLLDFNVGECALIKEERNYFWKLIKLLMICTTLRIFFVLANLV